MSAWVPFVVVLSPALVSFAFALGTFFPGAAGILKDHPTLEVVQDVCIHGAFYAPLAAAAIFKFVIEPSSQNRWLWLSQLLAVVFIFAALYVGRLCAVRRLQLVHLEKMKGD